MLADVDWRTDSLLNMTKIMLLRLMCCLVSPLKLWFVMLKFFIFLFFFLFSSEFLLLAGFLWCSQLWAQQCFNSHFVGESVCECECVCVPTAVIQSQPWHAQVTSGQLLIWVATETLAQPLGSGAIRRREGGAVGAERATGRAHKQ